jgi:hypothetical protein
MDYVKAQEEWGDLVKHFDSISADMIDALDATDTEDTTNDLSSWLNQAEDEDLSSNRPDGSEVWPTRASVTDESIALYRCSYCNYPSAALRKCGGCGECRCERIKY